MLQMTLQLRWELSTRRIIHIADYPAHGAEYNDNYDDYPDGDPDGACPALPSACLGVNARTPARALACHARPPFDLFMNSYLCTLIYAAAYVATKHVTE